MAEKVLIVTPEHVELEFTVAGIGSRLLAAVIDTLFQLILLVVGLLLALAIEGGRAVSGGVARFRLFDSLVMAVLTFSVFVVLWGYYVFFETRWNGQTPGKRKVGLRVIRDSGHPIDFRAAAVRNLVRIVDWLPVGYLFGFGVMFFNPKWKRLGDYAAGTLVVQEQRHTPVIPQASESTAPRVLELAAFRFLDHEALHRLSHLPRKDYQTVRHFLQRRAELSLDTQQRLARDIGRAISKALNRPPAAEPAAFLEEVESAYRFLHGE